MDGLFHSPIISRYPAIETDDRPIFFRLPPGQILISYRRLATRIIVPNGVRNNEDNCPNFNPIRGIFSLVHNEPAPNKKLPAIIHVPCAHFPTIGNSDISWSEIPRPPGGNKCDYRAAERNLVAPIIQFQLRFRSPNSQLEWNHGSPKLADSFHDSWPIIHSTT